MCPAASETSKSLVATSEENAGAAPSREGSPARQGPGDTAVEPATEPRDEADCLVLSVSSDGVVAEIISAGSRSPENLRGASIDSFWPGALASAVKDHLKRVVRSRQVRCVELEDHEQRRHYEFILFAQGRDRAIVVARDVSRVYKERSHLEQLAYVDELTRLPNREWFLAELGQVIEGLRLRGGRAAVMCIDIRHVDIHGHAGSAAEAVLKELATRLAHGLRGVNLPYGASDERSSWAARVDANRFGVILPSIKSGEDVAAVATRLADALEHPVALGGAKHRVEVTTGIALYPQDGQHGVELYESAVTAVQDAGNSLSRRQKFHSGTVQMRALQRQDLEIELKTALERGEFALAYFPIVERSSRRVTGVEALVRWPSRVMGAMQIEEFVAAADFTGLMVPIGQWVLATALEQIEHWRASGCKDLSLAVNVSPQEFALGNVVDRIGRAVRSAGLDPELLTVEITEHSLHRDATRDFAVCRGLKELGARLAVDDYGIGACPFEHLSRSPVDSLKIHQRFISQNARGRPDRASCAAIVAMAHALGKSVVAEGVESAEQADLLEEIGCDYLQGFFFSEPLGADEFSARSLARELDRGED